MMTDEEIITLTRCEASRLGKPSDIARFTLSHMPGGIHEFNFIVLFRKIFPQIPISVMLCASPWICRTGKVRINGSGPIAVEDLPPGIGIDDNQFDELLETYLIPKEGVVPPS